MSDSSTGTNVRLTMQTRRLAVLNGSWKFPPDDQVYSQGLRELISAMMVVNPEKRPDVHNVIAMVEKVLSRLQ